MDKSKNDMEGVLEDALLWKQFKEGGVVAFTALSRKHYRSLYNYGCRFSTDEELVLDCIQEVFLHIWEHRRTLSETPYVKSYLLKALRHRIMKEGVRLKRFQHPDGVEFGSENDLPLENLIIDHERQLQLVSRLNLSLESLSKRQQEIIYLRFYQNLDNEQIAQVMGLNKVSVANLLYRTLKELRETWSVVDLFSLMLLWFW